MTKPGKNKIIVTSALPYANGPIHIGHLVEYIQTDIFVRFLKLIGEDAVYVCADDAHGAPIEIKSSQLGIKPEQLIAEVFEDHTRDFRNFLIDFDNYYTTNSPENQHYSDLIFNTLKNKGLIYTKEIEVTYCNHCKRTLPDRYVKGKCPKCGAPDQYGDVCEHCNAAYKTIDLIDPYCTICKNKPIRKKSNHYFFRLSQLSAKLQKWLTENKNLQPEIKNFVFNWIKTGLEDWNISRDGPYFGFKIPGEKDKYYYVWLDAPIGYIASTENYCKKNGLKTEDFWKNKNSKIYHFIGKDIIYFHFLFWPAILMESGFELPHDIVVHGFLTVNGEKMSKSRGTFFTAREFSEKYEPEYLRFYYAGLLSKTMSDIDLSLNDFAKKTNNELAANIGNFCFRTLSFLNKNFGGKIGEIDLQNELMEQIKEKAKIIEKNYRELRFNDVVRDILWVSSRGNKYFQDNEPWKLIKDDKEKAHKVLGLVANIVKILSILIRPIMPKFSLEIQGQLDLRDLGWKDIDFKLKNHKIGKEVILIKKMEISEEKENKATQKFPLNLKVAGIIGVKEHPDADKLYVLEVDLGGEKRQIVAGLRNHYTEEQLNGKKVIIVSNLKHAKLRGVESQGMLLAGDDGENVGVLTVTKSNAGDSVYFEGLENETKQLTHEEFSKIKMSVKGGKVFFDNRELKTDSETVKVEKARDGARVK